MLSLDFRGKLHRRLHRWEILLVKLLQRCDALELSVRQHEDALAATLLQRCDTLEVSLLQVVQETVQRIEVRHDRLERQIEQVRHALGRIEARQSQADPSLALQDHEFRAFSQWGEDGALQFLLRHVPIPGKTFVEFGVEDYTQCNTRFLLVNHNWQGLVIDGDAQNIERLRRSEVAWQHGLTPVHAFVTRDNINQILRDHGVTGEIGLLSIDIDGNDYWVWEAIDAVRPAIVVVEYNHRFGAQAAVTVPYDEQFDRRAAHHSMIYFGASLAALCRLGARKGYSFVGCTRGGVNAFFVRNDLRPEAIRVLSPEEGYVAGQFCETRDTDGQLVKTSPEEERRLVMSLPLVSVEEGKP
jgi:hypothetical protein